MWQLKDLIRHVGSVSVEINGKWVPCRPIVDNNIIRRFRNAWSVFIGKADSFVWPEGQ